MCIEKDNEPIIGAYKTLLKTLNLSIRGWYEVETCTSNDPWQMTVGDDKFGQVTEMYFRYQKLVFDYLNVSSIPLLLIISG